MCIPRLRGASVPPRSLALIALLACACPNRWSTDDSGDSVTDDSDPGDRGAPVALVADGANQRYLWLNLATQQIIHELDMRQLFPQHCVAPWECVAFGSEPGIDPETGEDLALLISYITAEGDSPRDPGLIAKVRLGEAGPAVDWSLDKLDWTVNFADQPEICAQVTPCEAPDPAVAGNEIWQNCTIRNAHAVEVVEESDSAVTMWIADTGQPSRAIKVTLDKSSTCAVVDEVHGELTSPDWSDESGPNDIEIFDYEGQQAMLLNHLGTAGNDALGVATLWTQAGEGWELVYRHPVDGGLVMGGHNSDMVVAGDGQRYHIYAHGNGAGVNENINAWDDRDHRGTIGILRVEDDAPVYLLDATAPDPGFGFLRDADLLADGSFLVTDSGCMNHNFVDCDREPALWHVRVAFDALQGTGQSGAFSTDHAQQRFAASELVEEGWAGRVTCGFSTPYEADLIWEDQLGPFLQAALEAPEASCEEADSEASTAR
jgi:hypothetical protein